MAGRDRSIVARLRLEIADYRSKASEVKRLNADIATSADSASKKSSTGFSRVTDAIGKNSTQLNQLGTAAGGLGVLVGAGVGLAVKSFADFDKQMSNVSATGTDAKNNLAALRDTAVKAGADTAFSAVEAADGIEQLLKAGVSAQDVMGGGLAGALSLAAAGGLSVADAAETAATAMTQFGLEGSDVTHIADLLAAGAGKAQGDVSDLAAALKQGGLVAASYGLSIEETTGTLAAFASAGLLGSDAGTSFKTMLQSLGNPSAKAAEAMKELGINAYDAGGNFVGTAALAGQLQDRLGTLTQEQRNAALATIFGSDAVRAANVLYEQGAAGIQGWIEKVDDAGYAAQVAADKQNNLAGDLEFLGGTIDSVFLKSGSGANEVLRGLVQGADDLIGKIGDLPPGLLQAGLGIAAVGSGGLLAFAGVTKLATGAVELRGALKDIAPAGSNAAGALGLAGKAAGVAVVAFAALAAGVALQNQLTGDLTPKSSEATSALLALASGTSAADGAIKQFFTTTQGGAGGIDGLADAAAKLAGANSVQLWSADVARSLGLQSNEITQAQDRFTELDRSLSSLATSGSADQAGAAFLKLAQDAAAAGLGYEQLIQMFPQYQASLVDQANQLGITTLSARDYAAWMQGQVPPAVAAAQAAQEAHTGATKAGTAANQEQTQSLGELVTALFGTADAFAGLVNAEIGYEAAIDAATAAVKENGRVTDLGTEKGRANATALGDLAGKARAYVQEQVRQGASTASLTSTTANARTEFVKVAQQMGYTKKEAESLANKYGLIPKNVKTAVSSPGATTAQSQVDTLKAKINQLPASKQAVINTILDRSGVDAANAALASVTSKTVVITTVSRGSRNNTGQSVASAYAYGGQVDGWSPHPRADNIHALLTAREWVQPVDSVDYYGAGFMSAIQHRAIPREALPRFANGGQATQPARSPQVFTVQLPAPSQGRPVEQTNHIYEQEDPRLTARYLGRQLTAAMGGQ